MNMIELPIDKDTVRTLAENVLGELTKKIKDDLSEAFYSEMNGYIYEHYENARARVENELLDKLVNQYTNDPEYYKFYKLRLAIFDDNKDKILPSLTDEAIKESIEKVVHRYTHKDYTFEWQWFDGLAQFMCEHYGLFADSERFNQAYTRKVENLENRVKYLEQQLQEAGIV